MSSIFNFPNRPTNTVEVQQPYAEQMLLKPLEVYNKRVSSGGWIVWNVFKFLLMIIRTPVFLILYFLRAPVMVVCTMLYLPLFLLALFAWYAFSEKPQMWGGFGVISLLSFVLMYVYDLVLSWLSPHELVRTL